MLKWIKRIQSFEPYSIGFRFCETCNLKCSYCPFTYNGKNYLNEEQVFSIIDKVAEFSGKIGRKIDVSYTGGEPTIQPYFIDLVKHTIKSVPNLVSVYVDSNFGGIHANIEEYKKLLKTNKFFIRWSLHPDSNFDKLFEIYNYLKSPNVRSRMIYGPSTKEFVISKLPYFVDDINFGLSFMIPLSNEFYKNEFNFVKDVNFGRSSAENNKFLANIDGNYEIVTSNDLKITSYKGMYCTCSQNNIMISSRGFAYLCIDDIGNIPVFDVKKVDINKWIKLTKEPVICKHNTCSCGVNYEKFIVTEKGNLINQNKFEEICQK